MASSTWKRPSGSDSPGNNDFWKAEANNGREPVGTSIPSSAENLSADPGYGKFRKRGTTGKSDPLGQTMGAGHRSNDGKVGATYRIQAHLPAQTNEAACVQANGRILKPVTGRSNSFYVQGVYDETSRKD